jgi:hypothetical protein
LPNLNERVRGEAKMLRINGMNRAVVLAMHKHLLTCAACSHIANALTVPCRNEDRQAMYQDQICRFDGPLQPPQPIHACAAAE